MRLKKRAGASLARQPRRVQPPPEGSGKSLVGGEGPHSDIGRVAGRWQALFVPVSTSVVLGGNRLRGGRSATHVVSPVATPRRVTKTLHRRIPGKRQRRS